MTNLSGWWAGTYSYRTRIAPTSFEAELRDHGGRLSGLITEDGDSPRSIGLVLQATLIGRVSGSSVEFTKIYDDVVRSHSVFYEGGLIEDGMAIEGVWRTSATWSGPFRMERRSARRELSETVREAVPAD